MQHKVADDTPEEQLADLASAALDEHGSPTAALTQFAMQVYANPLLVRALALLYLQERAGQGSGDTPMHGARTGEAAGQTVRDTQVAGAGASSFFSGRGVGHNRHANHTSIARPGPEPSAAYLRAQERIKMRNAQTILDTYKVSDGRAIGNVLFCEIPKLRRHSLREAYILDQLQGYVANPTSNHRIRDIIKAADLDALIREADRVTNATA